MDNNFLFQVLSDKEAELREKVLDELKNYDIKKMEELQKKLRGADEESRLKISFVGQHNAGKSTIVSALTGDKNIKISSNVETDATSKYEWGNVLLFDTPGLFAGVKTSHDEEAYEAINKSDLLVFCITSSLFDDLLIEDFVNLAYKRSYKKKIILLVNKMSQEDGEFEDLQKNYYKTLATTIEEQGGKLEDFPLAFVDAKDYRDGLADEDEEFVELSNFKAFISLLNEQVESKGLYARILTKCTIMTDYIADEISSVDTELNQNMMIMLNRLKRAVLKFKRETGYLIKDYEINLQSEIINIGSEVTELIGERNLTEKDYEEMDSNIKKATEKTIEEIENKLQDVDREMLEEIGDVLDSDIAQYVFTEINSDKSKMETVTAIDLKGFVDKYGQMAGALKTAGQAVAKYAFKEGTDISKLAAASGTGLHKAVLNIGHFFGKKFVPYEAVKITSRIGKVASAIGPIISVVDIAVTVADKAAEEDKIKKNREAKQRAGNSISSMASDIAAQIHEQYLQLEKEMFDAKVTELEQIKDNMIKDCDTNSDYVNKIKSLREEYLSLIKSVEDIDAVE